VRERQRPKQDAIDQAEDGGGGSDAERKREDCGDSESRTAAKISDREGHVLQQRREHGVIMTGLARRLKIPLTNMDTTRLVRSELFRQACRHLRGFASCSSLGHD
jgi:hypothetical protein